MKKIKKLNNKYLYLIGIVHVYSTFNNTLITITNIKGQTILFGSCGFLNLKGAKRSTSYAGQLIAETLGKKMLLLGLRFIFIQFKGFGNSRKSILKGFKLSHIKALKIKDCTGICHNGCKQKKQRRI
jgi:small subunit ribosomal protein S11